MKKLLYLSAFLFITVFLSAQDCPDGSVTFTTQEEVDMFLQTYPDCKEIQGSLIIDTNVNNLVGLLGITSISGGIVLRDNPNLTNFSGLDSLVSIGHTETEYIPEDPDESQMTYYSNSLLIRNCSGLTSIDGLLGLESIPGRIHIEDNSSLENLDGLSSLSLVGSGSEYIDLGYGDYIFIANSSLFINNNSTLSSVLGIGKLITADGSIKITNNNNLEGSVLAGLQSIGEEDLAIFIIGEEEHQYLSLQIKSNPKLSLCTNPGLCRILSTEENTSVTNNGLSCTKAEILANCNNLSSVFHPMFYDNNENGLHDLGEVFLNGGKVDINPGNFSSITNQENGGIVYLNEGSHILSLDTSALQNWSLTSDSISFNISLDTLGSKDSIYFGIYPNTFISEMCTNISSQALRCNETVTFDVLANNSGTTITNGTLWLEADLNMINVSYVDDPDIFIEPNLYGWNFTDFYPNTSIKKQIQFQIPGPDDFPIGDALMNTSEVTYSDVNGADTTSFLYSQILTCAYDPNDKLVGPMYPQNYALIGDPLFYTIRFQNTGNAEAYDVLIQDEIDLNLDINSLQLIGSSHPEVLSISVNEDRLVKFEFRDIFLPDSTTNFEESQGYVSFIIKAKSDVAEFTTVENYAEIIFDYNPAIVTNTTQNIMVSTFDADFDGSLIWEDCDDTEGNVNPEADEVPYDGLDNDCDPETLDDDLDQDGFVLADDCDDTNADVNPDAEEIPDNGIDEDCDGDDLTGIEEIDVATIQFYPNPVKQTLILKQVGTSISEYEVRMYNTTGKVIYKAEFSNTQKSLNLADVDPGFYFLNFVDTNSGQEFSRKILVEGM